MRKEKKSKWGAILVFFIAFIMISSIVGFIYSEQDNQFKYNKIKFTKTSTEWRTTINNQQLTFDYFPSDVEQIELGDDVATALLNKPEIDATSELNDTFSEEIALANYNMALTLNKLNIYVMGGFTTNSTFNLPILTCKDATQAVPIIYFKQSNQTKVTLKNSCIIAEAKNNIDILRIKDRLIYAMLGIIG